MGSQSERYFPFPRRPPGREQKKRFTYQGLRLMVGVGK